MDRDVFEEISRDFNEALPALIAGKPDRTDLMIPLCRAKDWLHDRTIGPGEVRAAILEVYGISLAELYARERHDTVSIEARQMASYVMIKTAGMSRSAAARAMRRDRATLCYSIEKIGDLINNDPDVTRHHQRVLKVLGVFEA